MSDVRDKVAGTIEWLIGERSELAEDEILQSFKAHIEGCEKPKNPYDNSDHEWAETDKAIYNAAIEAYRKALMESLK